MAWNLDAIEQDVGRLKFDFHLATEWKWKEDDMIVAEAVRLHVAMINEWGRAWRARRKVARGPHGAALCVVVGWRADRRINELIGE